MHTGNSLALFVSRVIVGVVLIAHGWQKFHEWTIAGTTSSFEDMGVPMASAAAPFAAGLELIGGGLLIVGLFTRVVGYLVAAEMVGAGIFAGHFENGVFVTNGGWELVMVIAAAALAFAAAGPGRFALDHAAFGGRRREKNGA